MLSLFAELTYWFKAKPPEGSKQAAGPSRKKNVHDFIDKKKKEKHLTSKSLRLPA